MPASVTIALDTQAPDLQLGVPYGNASGLLALEFTVDEIAVVSGTYHRADGQQFSGITTGGTITFETAYGAGRIEVEAIDFVGNRTVAEATISGLVSLHIDQRAQATLMIDHRAQAALLVGHQSQATLITDHRTQATLVVDHHPQATLETDRG